jgi:hypothetical protein
LPSGEDNRSFVPKWDNSVIHLRTPLTHAITRRALSPSLSLSLDLCLPPGRCPDCNDAKPIIEASLAKASASAPLTLLEMPLVRADYSGNPSHPFRTHAAVKLQRIPTLMKWGRKGKVAELVEGDCAKAELIDELLE